MPSRKGALLSVALLFLMAWGVLADKTYWDVWLWPYPDVAFWTLVGLWFVAAWRWRR